MDGCDITGEVIKVLGRRRELIDALQETARDKRTLEDELGIPRSTLDRAIRELRTLELVTYWDGEYALSPIGARIRDAFGVFTERVELTLEYKPFLQWIPPDEFDLDYRLLADAELLVPEAGNPYAMNNRHVQTLEQSSRFRGVLPLTTLPAHKATHRRIVEYGAEAELIVEPAVAEIMVSDPLFVELTSEMRATNRFELFVYDGEIPYFVGLLDDIVQLGAHEDGEPRALVETRRREVRRWAHTTIDHYKRQATPAAETTITADTVEADRLWTTN